MMPKVEKVHEVPKKTLQTWIRDYLTAEWRKIPYSCVVSRINMSLRMAWRRVQITMDAYTRRHDF